MKKFPVKEIRVRRASRYAAVCRLDRFEKRAVIRASTYAAPRETARRGAKVRGDVSPRKVTTIPRPEIALCNLTATAKRLHTNQHSSIQRGDPSVTRLVTFLFFSLIIRYDRAFYLPAGIRITDIPRCAII